MTVYDVLEYLASGMSQQEILDDFPYLSKEDILACLSFAANRERLMVALQPEAFEPRGFPNSRLNFKFKALTSSLSSLQPRQDSLHKQIAIQDDNNRRHRPRQVGQPAPIDKAAHFNFVTRKHDQRHYGKTQLQ